MKATPKLVVLLLCLSVCLTTVYGQGRCTMQNIAGSYAFSFSGASAIAGPAQDGFHWNALYAPIAGVGIFTIGPNGKADGHYWLIAGQVSSGLTAIPLHSTVTLNADCTGTFASDFQGSTLIERFVILGNGREIRAVATQTAVPTGNWITTANRIDGSCGQNKVHGDYLIECKNLFPLPVDPPNIFGGAIHIRARILPNGDWSGTTYGKVGPSNAEFPAYGHITVNDDCTAEGTNASPFLPTVNTAKGVFFDEGRRAYWLPLVNTFPDDSTQPLPYGYCTITKIDNK